MIGTRRAVRFRAISGVTGRWVETDIYAALTGGLTAAYRDIHKKKLVEERRRLVVAKLTHRIKDTFTLVLAVAEQTRRD
ncbi:hypothetical protein [Falsiroseomonas sp. E2-1-a20]|uniref:hypothetical protein n=1 Tax=Falsiroseomonas sp. E2-1-a20 TaxID=3239300 RepID=UPI003F361949